MPLCPLGTGQECARHAARGQVSRWMRFRSMWTALGWLPGRGGHAVLGLFAGTSGGLLVLGANNWPAAIAICASAGGLGTLLCSATRCGPVRSSISAFPAIAPNCAMLTKTWPAMIVSGVRHPEGKPARVSLQLPHCGLDLTPGIPSVITQCGKCPTPALAAIAAGTGIEQR